MKPRPAAMTLLAALAALSAGCSSIGNVVFAPHPASLRDADPAIALRPCGRVAAAGAAGVAVAALQTFLEKEAEQYRATYSAATHGDLAKERCVELTQADLVALRFQLDDPTDRPAWRVVHGRFQPTGTRSKVVSLPWRTLAKGQNPFGSPSLSGKIGNAIGFINPLLYLHFLWGLVDSDVYKVDFAVRAKVETVVPKDRQVSTSELTVPVGKLRIDDIASGTAVVDDLESGYVPAPEGATLLSNVTVTVVEANDLGDVVGKAAGLVGEHKQDLTDRLSGFLGLE